MSLLSLVPLPYRILAMAALVLSCFGFGYVKGEAHTIDRYEQEDQQRYQQAQQRVNHVATEVAQAAEKTRTVTQTITKEVIRYVQVHPDHIELPPDWRVLHDAAATNTSAASQPFDKAQPTDDAAAIQTVSANYAECQRWRDQVIGWQAYYEALQ